MSNPNPYPTSGSDTQRRPRPTGPLLWILVLIALFAFGWYFYNRFGARTLSPSNVAPAAVSIGSPQETSAARERKPEGGPQDTAATHDGPSPGR